MKLKYHTFVKILDKYYIVIHKCAIPKNMKKTKIIDYFITPFVASNIAFALIKHSWYSFSASEFIVIALPT